MCAYMCMHCVCVLHVCICSVSACMYVCICMFIYEFFMHRWFWACVETFSTAQYPGLRGRQCSCKFNTNEGHTAFKAGIHGATSCRFVARNSNEYGQMFRKPSVY